VVPAVEFDSGVVHISVSITLVSTDVAEVVCCERGAAKVDDEACESECEPLCLPVAFDVEHIVDVYVDGDWDHILTHVPRGSARSATRCSRWSSCDGSGGNA
jgi:hypothetical protein